MEFIQPCVIRAAKSKGNAIVVWEKFCDKRVTRTAWPPAFCNFPPFPSCRDPPRCRNLYLASFSAERTEVCTRRRVHYAYPCMLCCVPFLVTDRYVCDRPHVRFRVLFGNGNSTVSRMEKTTNDPRRTVISRFRRCLLYVTCRFIAR